MSEINNDVLGSIEVIAKNNIKSDGMKSIFDLVHVADNKLTEKCADPVVEAVRQDLLNRSHVGIVKYGTTLYENMGDLRYWLQHSYEECLDHANYLKRAIMELDKQSDDNK